MTRHTFEKTRNVRIMMLTDIEKVVTDSDHHFIFVRPKSIIGSSGTVWASETVKLR